MTRSFLIDLAAGLAPCLLVMLTRRVWHAVLLGVAMLSAGMTIGLLGNVNMFVLWWMGGAVHLVGLVTYVLGFAEGRKDPRP